MMEYFAYKKFKKHKEQKLAEAKEKELLLDQHDENFLKKLTDEVSDDDPELVVLSGVNTPATSVSGAVTPAEHGQAASGTERSVSEPVDAAAVEAAIEGKDPASEKGKAKVVKDKSKRWSVIQSKLPFGKKQQPPPTIVTPDDVPASDKTKEELDIQKTLDELSLLADGQNAFSLDEQTRKLAMNFLQILKDLMNGVPTAYDDLTHFFDKEDDKIKDTFEKMPGFMQKLVKTLPTKLTGSLAPELLAVAAEAQGLATAAGESHAGTSKVKAVTNLAAKAGVAIPSLKELVTKPGAIAGLLKSVMNVLKLRWPAFMGANVVWSVGLFVLMFVLWYCHKRGREVRKEKEAAEMESSREVLVPGTKPAGQTAALDEPPIRPTEIEEPMTPPAVPPSAPAPVPVPAQTAPATAR